MDQYRWSHSGNISGIASTMHRLHRKRRQMRLNIQILMNSFAPIEVIYIIELMAVLSKLFAFAVFVDAPTISVTSAHE